MGQVSPIHVLNAVVLPLGELVTPFSQLFALRFLVVFLPLDFLALLELISNLGLFLELKLAGPGLLMALDPLSLVSLKLLRLVQLVIG